MRKVVQVFSTRVRFLTHRLGLPGRRPRAWIIVDSTATKRPIASAARLSSQARIVRLNTSHGGRSTNSQPSSCLMPANKTAKAAS